VAMKPYMLSISLGHNPLISDLIYAIEIRSNGRERN
jgi:hypothetical protein